MYARLHRKLDWVAIVASLLAGLVASNAWAQASWRSLVPFEQRVEYNPKKEYWVHQGNGPWMILAANFSGPNAMNQSRALIKELRTRYNLQAYLHKRNFDFNERVIGKGFEKGQREPGKRMKYLRDGVSEQFVVLVGNYPSINTTEVTRTLEKLKYSWPKTLEIDKERGTSQNLAFLREVQRRLHLDEDRKKRGPMASAFATRNPLLPQEYFTPKGVDSFVYSMNKDVKHSLLKCRAKYSVKVASFRGGTTLKPTEFQATDKLVQAAERAHKLTEALRKRGVEAFEFHDRHESIVTIGSFNEIGDKMANGRTELRPAVYRIMQQYGAERKRMANGKVGLAPRSFQGIPYEVQPMPIEVPRMSVANDYGNRLGFLR